jgi:1,2-diacylglycerol 3-alpha-glucosyltransferase
LKDTWGLVVNEAMAAGLPVIVSSRAGCAEDLVIDGVTGYRFDPFDVEDLTQLLLRITRSDYDREAMGERGRERIQSYSCQAFAEGLWNAIEAAKLQGARGLGVSARILLRTMRMATRHSRSFHTTSV